MKINQKRQVALYVIRVDGIDFALEQIHDGDYISLRDARMSNKMLEYDFRTKGARGLEK